MDELTLGHITTTPYLFALIPDHTHQQVGATLVLENPLFCTFQCFLN